MLTVPEMLTAGATVSLNPEMSPPRNVTLLGTLPYISRVAGL